MRNPGGVALWFDGEGDPVVLETFGGVDEVGNAPAKSGAWSATSRASWSSVGRRLEKEGRLGLIGVSTAQQQLTI
jgi:hypothetical protein